MVKRFCLRAIIVASCRQLIRRIADNHIKFHVKYLLFVIGMNKLIGVSFEFFATLIVCLVGPAMNATPIFPCVLNPTESYIPLWFIEGLAGGILSIGSFGAIHRTA